MNVYLMVAFIAMMVIIIGAVLMAFDRYLEKKRDEAVCNMICHDVIPRVEIGLEDYTEELLNSTKKMTEELMKAFTD